MLKNFYARFEMKGLWPLVKRWLTSRAPYVGVALCIVVIACVIDALRGKATELFNAWGVVVAVANKVGIGLTPPAKQFIYAQDKLGPWALPLGVAILHVVPAALAIFLVRLGRAFFRRRSQSG